MLHSLLRGRAITGGFIAFAAAAVITATALSPALGTGPEGITSFSGTSSGAIVTSHNSGTGQVISASGSTGASTGVIYATTAAAGSTAIRGYSTSTSATPSYGVIGVSKNAYGVEALTYSPSSLALFAYNVATSGGAIKGQSAGNAITGVSTKANGVVGRVSATPPPAPSAAFALAGVLGQDTSTSITGFNAGVAGTSTAGSGVAGVSTNGIGVKGVSTNQIGVQGGTTNGIGVQGFSSTFEGVEGHSNTSVGVLGVSSTSDAVRGVIGTGVASSFHAGVAGLDNSTSGSSNQGVFGDTTLGIGVQGQSFGSGTGVLGSSSSGFGVEGDSSTNRGVIGSSGNDVGVEGDSSSSVGVGASTESDTQPALVAISGNGLATPSSSVAVVTVKFNPSQSCVDSIATIDIFTIDQKGDVLACGTITGSATPLVIRRTTLGQHLVSYAAQQSQPTIEDLGQGRLVNGQGYVAIEPRFAATIDARAHYLVFLTPYGDNRGLYVAQQTHAGFLVRESQGGRSTLAFDYRIVAKPFDTNAPRLPLASSLPHPRPVALPLLRHQTRPQFRTVPRLRQ